ncbi:MAG: Ig-like domain-containing protein [Oscillospiraceae bacterium]
MWKGGRIAVGGDVQIGVDDADNALVLLAANMNDADQQVQITETGLEPGARINLRLSGTFYGNEVVVGRKNSAITADELAAFHNLNESFVLALGEDALTLLMQRDFNNVPKPVGLKAETYGPLRTRLFWTNQWQGRWEIQRKKAGDAEFQQIRLANYASPYDSVYCDTMEEPGTYVYRVKTYFDAYDSIAKEYVLYESDWSDEASVTVTDAMPVLQDVAIGNTGNVPCVYATLTRPYQYHDDLHVYLYTNDYVDAYAAVFRRQGGTQTIVATSYGISDDPLWSASGFEVSAYQQSGRYDLVELTMEAGGETVVYNEAELSAVMGLGKPYFTVAMSDPKVLVTGLTLTSSALTLTEGGQGTVGVASVSPPTATNKAVTWSSSNTAVATVGATGLVAAKAPGSATITATAVDGGVSASCVVTVQRRVVPVSGVSLNITSHSLKEGETVQLVATVSPANADNKAVSWKSSETAVATVGAGGLVTAVKHGSVTITITTGDGAKTATSSITVLPVPTGVKLSQTTLQLAGGKKATVGAAVYLSDGSSTSGGLSWSSSNEKVAKVDAATGKVIAAKNLKKNGSATITATAENGKSAKVKVTVLKKGAKAVKADKVTISGVKKTLEVGKTAQLKVKVSPSKATGAVATFKSSKASVLSVDKAGKLTAVKEGSAKLTVSAGGKKATATVKVTAPVKSIKLDKKSVSLPKKKATVTVTPTVTYNVEGYNAKLTWKSSDKKVATVKNGKITAKGKGKATITVSASNGKKAKLKVTVKK